MSLIGRAQIAPSRLIERRGILRTVGVRQPQT